MTDLLNNECLVPQAMSRLKSSLQYSTFTSPPLAWLYSTSRYFWPSREDQRRWRRWQHLKVRIPTRLLLILFSAASKSNSVDWLMFAFITYYLIYIHFVNVGFDKHDEILSDVGSGPGALDNTNDSLSDDEMASKKRNSSSSRSRQQSLSPGNGARRQGLFVSEEQCNWANHKVNISDSFNSLEHNGHGCGDDSPRRKSCQTIGLKNGN